MGSIKYNKVQGIVIGQQTIRNQENNAHLSFLLYFHVLFTPFPTLSFGKLGILFSLLLNVVMYGLLLSSNIDQNLVNIDTERLRNLFAIYQPQRGLRVNSFIRDFEMTTKCKESLVINSWLPGNKVKTLDSNLFSYYVEKQDENYKILLRIS